MGTLADTHGKYAVGVILTGTGSDGAAGLKKIKSAGGLALVQEPDEAEYDGMPRSAIAAGFVDRILPVVELAKQVVRFTATEPQIPSVPDDDEAPAENLTLLQQIFAQIRAHEGQDFSAYKISTVLRRIRRRMQLRQFEHTSDYLKLLRESPEESKSLADDLLITVTNFFRDSDVFETIKKDVLPQIFAGKGPQDRVRLWCVGCATGEEAYSLGILLLEYAGQLLQSPELQIFASDLHQGSLNRAREGFYPDAIEHDVSPERLNRYFTRVKGGFQIRKEVRSLVVFATHNLLRDPPFSQVDLISCRNLLIYLKRGAQDEALKIFHYSLNPGKFLLLGGSENADRPEYFRLESKPHSLFTRRTATVHETRPGSFFAPSNILPVHLPSFRPPNLQLGAGALHQKLVERYAPPSILLSPDLNIVHLSEHAGEYLAQPGGEPTSNILKRIRNELLFEVSALIQSAKRDRQAVRSRPVTFRVNGHVRQVVLTARLSQERELEDYTLLLFDDASVDATSELTSPAATPAANGELEAELERSKGRLQKLIEEFEAGQEEMWASNEELQSTNEELRSTMEELETSKEELQSMNEELQTVNQENKHKVEELSQLSGDLQNLLTATDIATLFLDRSLRILRFTPRVGQLFNIRPVDRGRPLADLTHRLGYPSMLADAHSVLETLVPIENEVRREDGSWFLLRMLPYRTPEDRIDGVVLTFVDISRVRSAERATQEGEERFQLLLNNAHEYAIFMLDKQGCIISWNPGAGRIFGYSERECLGQNVSLIFTAEDRTDGVPEKELAKAADDGESSDERWHVHKDGSRFWASGVVTALRHSNGDLRGFSKILRDNTDRKRAEAELQNRNEELTRINGELEEFAYVASHDLQEPLRMINIYSQLLLSRIDLNNNPDAATYAEYVRSGVHRMEALMDDLLDYSRAVHSEYEEPDSVDSRRALDQALRVLEARIHETGAKINVGDLPTVRAHQDHVTLVFQNLLSNSLKYSKENQAPEIQISSRREGPRWVITTTDNGIGFAPKYAERIFGLFKRLHKNAYPGTGLGLAICKRVLQRYGGEIWATSPGEGSGASFAFALPAENENTANGNGE